MNRSQSPSTGLRAPSPPLGEKDGMRGYGSWVAPTISKSRIEARNRRRQTFVAYATKVCTGGDDGSWKGNTSKELDVNRSHEPGIPLNRPSATLSPIGGEGWGEGARCMERE